MGKNGLLLIGKIVGVHGIRGTVKILSHAESWKIFKPGGTILSKHPSGQKTPYIIRKARPHKRVVLIDLEGITDRSKAQSLSGADVYIEKKVLPPLEDGTYYWADLIGLAVITTTGRSLGRIQKILPTGSNDVLVVKDDNDEILIPMIEAVIIEIDLKHQCIQVNLPEGLT